MLIRPCLEYFLKFWAPPYRKDVERVRKGIIVMLPGLEHFNYAESLDQLSFFSQEQRRLRDDISTGRRVQDQIS